MRLNAVKAIHHQEIHRRQRGRNCGEKKGNLATRGAQATKRASTGARGSRKGGKKNRKVITVDDFGSDLMQLNYTVILFQLRVIHQIIQEKSTMRQLMGDPRS